MDSVKSLLAKKLEPCTPIQEEVEAKPPKLLSRQIHRLLSFKKETSTQSVKADTKGPTIQRSVSVRLPTSVKPVVSQVPSTTTEKVEDTDKYPKPLPTSTVKLTRCATFRVETSRTTDKPLENSTNVSDSLCEAIPSSNYSLLAPSTRSLLCFRGDVLTVEERIRERISLFPTVLQQQSKGANYIPQWMWIRRLERLIETTKCPLLSTEESRKVQVKLHQFYAQVWTATTIIEQIRQDFYFGISLPENSSQNTFIQRTLCVEESMKDMKVSGSEGRGRNCLTIGSAEYVPEIWRKELKRQDDYAQRMGKPVSDTQTIRKRNEQAKWICEAAAKFKYPAEVSHLAVNLLDTYLTRGNKPSTNAWSLLGIGVLQIAGKMDEPNAVCIQQLLDACGSYAYRVEDVHWMERHILEKLQFDLYPPLAPVFAQIIIHAGSMKFPSSNIKKLVYDLSMGILHKSLLTCKLATVKASEKAQVALEIAVELIFYQYTLFAQRDLKNYRCVTSRPGSTVGDFTVDLCTTEFLQRFLEPKTVKLVLNNASPDITSSPVRGVKA